MLWSLRGGHIIDAVAAEGRKGIVWRGLCRTGIRQRRQCFAWGRTYRELMATSVLAPSCALPAVVQTGAT